MGLLGTLGGLASFIPGVGPIVGAGLGVAGSLLDKQIGGGNSNNKTASPFLQGLDPNMLAEGLRVSPEEQQASISQLLRTIGTLQTQSQNRTSDLAAAQGLPAASLLAAQRGNALQFAQAGQQGTFDIQQAAAAQNRSANQALLGLLAQDQQFQQQLGADRRSQTLGFIGNIGAAAGSLLGGYLANQ